MAPPKNLWALSIESLAMLGVLGQVDSHMASIYGEEANEDIKAVGRIITILSLLKLHLIRHHVRRVMGAYQVCSF